MAMVSGIRRVGDLLNYLIESQQTFLTFSVFFIEFCFAIVSEFSLEGEILPRFSVFYILGFCANILGLIHA